MLVFLLNPLIKSYDPLYNITESITTIGTALLFHPSLQKSVRLDEKIEKDGVYYIEVKVDKRVGKIIVPYREDILFEESFVVLSR